MLIQLKKLIRHLAVFGASVVVFCLLHFFFFFMSEKKSRESELISFYSIFAVAMNANELSQVRTSFFFSYYIYLRKFYTHPYQTE